MTRATSLCIIAAVAAAAALFAVAPAASQSVPTFVVPAADHPPPTSTPPAPASDRHLSDRDLGDGTIALDPIRHHSLTIIPIATTGTGSSDDYLTLDEGMKQKLVRIREVDADGSVNELRLKNRSDKPLFLMSGEVILGGKQDRIIGKNTVIPPRTEQTIPVFCVEHGRWAGRRTEFGSAGALAHSKLRSAADFESQSKVWSEVTDKNAKRQTSNDTDTYRHVAAQQSSGTIASWEKVFRTSLAALPREQSSALVGFAVAVNGQVVALDVFESPALFAKLDDKLLRSYITEAIDAPVANDAPTPAPADIRGFVAKVESQPEEAVYDTAEADTVNQIDEKTWSTKVKRKDAPASAKPVYRSTKSR